MRIALLGYFGFGNTGDEAVLAAEVEALRDSLGAATSFVVISGDPAYTERAHGLPAVSRTDARAVLSALRSADALVAGGGSLLQDVTSARPVAFYGGVMGLASLLGTPVFVYAQGLGPLLRPVNRRLAGWALRRSAYVGLRDDDSCELARSLGVSAVERVTDPVLGLSLAPVEAGSGLAVSLRPWTGEERWLPAVIAALRSLASSVEITLVPFHAGQDVELARRVADSVDSSVLVVDPSAGYRAVLEAVAGARAVLGMRLHALIAAAAAGRPFVALSYDPKVAAFADRVAQPVAADLTADLAVAAALSAERIEGAVRAALAAEEPAYLDRVAELRERARRPAVVIAERLRPA